MGPATPLVHPPYLAGYPSATEFFLPHPAMPSRTLEDLPEWMRQIATTDIDGIRRLLNERWATTVRAELFPLREQLLSYAPASIVVCEHWSWLRLKSEFDEEIIGSSAYLPSPAETSELARRLEEFNIPADTLFSNFLQNFAGLAEDFMAAGGFIDLTEEWETFSGSEYEDAENYEDWKGSLLIYHSRGGDGLLLRPDGHIGWWVIDQWRVTSDFDSLSAFVRFYVDYRDAEPWPLDSYGPS
jgi:hypothetical protein